MKGEDLPPGHHIATYCSPGRSVNGVASEDAFRIKKGHSYLSVNWVEYFDKDDLEYAIECVQHDLETDLELSANGVFALLNVAVAKTIIKTLVKSEPRVIHDPTDSVESHTQLRGYLRQDFAVSAALANAVLRTYPVQ